MPNLSYYIFSLIGYVLLARLSLSVSNRKLRPTLFCLTNVIGVIWLSLITRYSDWSTDTILSLGTPEIARHFLLLGIYFLVIVIGFFLMRGLARREGWLPWLAFFYPISLLIVFKYFYFLWDPIFDRFDLKEWALGATIVGLSYMAFRLSYMVLEVRNEIVEMPSLSEYLGFAFFLPTLLVGPINRYSTHQNSIREIDETTIPTGRALLRIIVGLTKYVFLANLANQLSYNGIFLDYKSHPLIDLGVAMVFYYFYLFLNFSGFCDMAIGVAGLIGIRVRENFDNPFAARNVKEFWNRWHITLSEYTRDVIFNPLSRMLIKKIGVKYTNFSLAVTILVVFLVIGVWHGVGLNFAVFGLIHAVGVIANHYYTIWLKRVLGKEKYKAYNENRLVNAAARLATFVYVAASFAVFANTRGTLGIIKNALLSGLHF